MSAETAEAVVAPEVVQPETADAAEALVQDLDRERAELAARFQAHDRNRGAGVDDHWTAIAQDLTREALELDRRRGEAKLRARTLKEREASRAAWQAWHAVYPQHREICSRIVAALDELIPAVEAELALHRLLRERAGRSMLPDLRADLDKLRRLRWSAGVVAEAKPERRNNGESR